MSLPRIVIATRNAHKVSEFATLLGNGYEVCDLEAWSHLPAVEEDGATFEANAAIKALAISVHTKEWVLADDSGLEVDALDGAPGIFSARYAGIQATDAENREKLLRELEIRGVRGKARSARFRCALALARGGEVKAAVEGKVEGILANTERGNGGFGYDSLFIPEGHCQTFAELSPVVKHVLSHRARALRALAEVLPETLQRGS